MKKEMFEKHENECIEVRSTDSLWKEDPAFLHTANIVKSCKEGDRECFATWTYFYSQKDIHPSLQILCTAPILERQDKRQLVQRKREGKKRKDQILCIYLHIWFRIYQK